MLGRTTLSHLNEDFVVECEAGANAGGHWVMLSEKIGPGGYDVVCILEDKLKTEDEILWFANVVWLGVSIEHNLLVVPGLLVKLFYLDFNDNKYICKLTFLIGQGRVLMDFEKRRM